MEQFFVTIFERTLDRSAEQANALPAGVAVELRTDALARPAELGDLRRFRTAVERPLLLTRRSAGGNGSNPDEMRAALEAGFEWVDLEFTRTGEGELPPGVPREQVLASIHDYDGVPSLDTVLSRLASFPHIKIAATPRTFQDNLDLLAAQRRRAGTSSIFGMGARGLYSRYLSPFLGGRPAFVAPQRAAVVAPGQLTLEQALAVYGPAPRTAESFFAVIGNPSSHSRSPLIHNQIFRRMDVDAAYGVIEVDECCDVLEAMRNRTELAPTGLSITAPFKVTAHEWLRSIGADVSVQARAAGAVNTVVMTGDTILGENTDVIAIRELLAARATKQSQIIVLGAGGTARAAAVALRELRLPFVIANRNLPRAQTLASEFGADSAGLTDIARLNPTLIIDTLPASSDWTLPDAWLTSATCLIRADYSSSRPDEEALTRSGGEFVDGSQMLLLQARAQAHMFLRAAAPNRNFESILFPEVYL